MGRKGRRSVGLILVVLLASSCSSDGTYTQEELERRIDIAVAEALAGASATSVTTQPATTTTAAASTTTTGATTTMTERSEPVVRGPSAYVVGREECRLLSMAVPLTETRPEPGVEQGRDGEFDCTVTANDPRVAGSARYTLNQNRWGTGPSDGTLVQWGTAHIENDDGAWDAEYVGVYTSETGDVVAALFGGIGAYEGLSYYRWSFETYGSTWPTQGVIFPAIGDR